MFLCYGLSIKCIFLFNADSINSTFSCYQTGQKAPVISQSTLLVKVIPKLCQTNEMRPFQTHFIIPHLFNAVSKMLYTLVSWLEDMLDIHLFTTQNHHGIINSSSQCKTVLSANTSQGLSINWIYIYDCPSCVHPTVLCRLNIKEDTINI